MNGKQVPSCKCNDLYIGKTCNSCKDTTMQFPGCHTLKTKKMEKDSKQEETRKFSTKRNNQMKQKCMNAIPPTLDTYEDLRFNGEARVSGKFSISDINNQIKLYPLNKKSNKGADCLFGSDGVNVRVYIEYLEESYINKPLPITLQEKKGEDSKVLTKSEAVWVPGMDSSNSIRRGEYLEYDLAMKVDTPDKLTRVINFDLSEVAKNGASVMNNG